MRCSPGGGQVPGLRIIDQDLWDRVKVRQETMRCDTRPDVRARPCDRRRPRYLLSGLIVCGACGGSYTKISANLFGCAAARNKGAAVCTQPQEHPARSARGDGPRCLAAQPHGP
jgi:site-specific DNA recombinase